MNKKFASLFAVAAIALSAGCTRIETGEVGLRTGWDKTVNPTELLPGSFNQVVIGDVTLFKIQEVGVQIDNLQPQAADNSTFKDFDMTVIYNVTPTSVSDLWTTKNRGFHTVDSHGDILLMNTYVAQTGKNAAMKAVRKYEALKANDSRSLIEQDIKAIMQTTFAEEHLDKALTIQQVQVRTIMPADSITESANALVRAQNELSRKTIEVQTAGQEALRIAALNSNAKAIDYMNAQSNMKIAEAVAAGKVNTIIVPFDFKGMLQVPAHTGK